ncbi:MAG: c-type cytochrome domain-containing protein [Planctomycetota bacterium]|jgi:uncharacterized membrane protein
MDTLKDLLAVFGRMHPMVLHLPIGMLIGLALMELVGWKRGAPPASRWLLVFATSTAVIASASGWMLHEEDGYASSFALDWHERLGIATAFAALGCCWLRFRGSTQQYRLTLLLTVGVMVATGHFGAEMTHGRGFLLEPFGEGDDQTYVPISLEEVAVSQSALASFEEHIAPLLGARCTRCHGRRKSKGELRLDSPAAILAGGESGRILGGPEGAELVPGEVSVEESELYRRLLLPLEHEDHMPPESKTQLGASEIMLLRMWLEAGAPFDRDFALGEGVSVPATPIEEDALAEVQDEEASGPVHDLDKETYLKRLDALRNEQVSVEPVASGSRRLVVSFVPVKHRVDDAMVARLLSPLLEYVEELVLANTMVTDRTLDLVAKMPHVVVMNLDQVEITDSGLLALSSHASLEQLVLSRTLVTSESAALFQGLPRLTDLYLWGTAFSPDEIRTLRGQLPQVAIDFGDSFQSEPLEVEAALVFTGDAPLVDAPPVVEANSLVPVNRQCPVSGKPVDPRYTVVHQGEVLAFCCPNCPKAFWEDPAAYPVD